MLFVYSPEEHVIDFAEQARIDRKYIVAVIDVDAIHQRNNSENQ